MKFSFLYAHKKTDQWNTPLSIINELKKRGHECRIYSIFNDAETGYSEDGIIKMLNDAHNGVYIPDIIMHMDFGLYRSPYLTKQYFPNAVWIFESGDDPQSFNGYNFPKAQHGKFDIILSPDIRCVDFYNKQGFNAYWWTHFADTNLYNIDEIEPKYDAVSTRDVTEPFFAELKKAYPETFYTSRGYHGVEHTVALKQGRIVIQNSKYKEITRRIFEGMLAKRMVITDRIPESTGINHILEEYTDIVYYDDIQDAIQKIKYFTEHPIQREQVAINGYNKTLNNHTQIQRVDKLLEAIHLLR